MHRGTPTAAFPLAWSVYRWIRHSGHQVWLHGDLKPTNLLVRQGRLHAVIDFGCLSVGLPDAEHSTLWDFPPGARQAYWNALNLDEVTWLRQ